MLDGNKMMRRLLRIAFICKKKKSRKHDMMSLKYELAMAYDDEV